MIPPMPGYTDNPGYVDLFRDTYRAMKWHYRPDAMANYTFPNDFFTDFNYYYSFPASNTYPIFYIAIVFTLLRYAFNKILSDVSFKQILKLNYIHLIVFLLKYYSNSP